MVLPSVSDFNKITVITGAGISAPSGLPTYRGKEDSLWNDEERLRKSDIGYILQRAEHVDEMWEYWRPFREMLRQAQPNPAHLALAEAEKNHSITIGTQNVDGLHQKAGSTKVHELHGSIFYDKCLHETHEEKCTQRFLSDVYDICPACAGPMRPDVVMFGELLPFDEVAAIEKAVINADLVIYIGTSGNVYPVAGYVDVARQWHKPVWLVNDEEWEHPHPGFTQRLFGPCEEILPELFGCK